MSRAVGIDLGTTNSVVAVLEGGEPRVIANAEGARTTPSVVAFGRGEEVLVGEVARRQAVTNVDRTVRSVKRRIGTDWTLPVGGACYTPQQISGFVLAKLKADAEAFLGEEVTDAVITVPAYFTDAQRQATKDAGEIAGFTVRRIINEPTAAALAYGLARTDADATVLVFDLGGGTLDVSLLATDADPDGFTTTQVIATSGDNSLGGDDWDAALADWLADEFAAEHPGVDLRAEATARARLTEAAEAAKVALTHAAATDVSLPYATVVDGQPVHLQRTVTRAEFERLTGHLLERLRAPFDRVLADAAMGTAEIDHVVLVGGSTRMPAVVDLVRSLTGQEPSRQVNPDEVVAAGAALQAGVLTGDRTDVLLIDVTPLTLGIETRGGVMSPVIERNTAVPVRRSQVFTTGEDHQSSVKIRVFQGEREMVADNQLLGNFKLTGIPPAPRGVPQIEVVFDIDADGIVHVSARDVATGKEQRMTVSGTSALSADEIERMAAEATANAASDRARRDLAEARNAADALAHQVASFLAETTDGLPEQLVTAVREQLAAVRDRAADPAGTLAAVRAETERLSVLAQQLGEALYAAADTGRETGTAVGRDTDTDDGGDGYETEVGRPAGLEALFTADPANDGRG